MQKIGNQLTSAKTAGCRVLGEALHSLEARQSMRAISSCHWVTETGLAAEELAVYTWGKGQEIAEGFSLVGWVMGMAGE